MSRPTWARWVTRISLILAVVALVFTIRDIGLRTIATYFRRIGWWWIAVVILEIAITSLDAVAIRSFLSPEQGKVRLRSAVLSQLAGRAVNAVTPSGNLGEAVKVSVLVDHVSQSRAVSTILLYNVVSFSVELMIVAVAAPIMVMLVPMPSTVRGLMIVTCVVCFVIAILLYTLVRRGVLESVARAATRVWVPGLARVRGWIWKAQTPSRYLLSQARYEGWRDRLRAVDSKMHLSSGARARDRWLGIAAVTASRLTSMSLSLMILHAVGESITLGFVAAYTVGGFIIYMMSTLVPMGVGISEGGNYTLFRALGENPARGVTLVLARRVTLIMYAGIGLVLVTASETVKRARERQAERASTSGHLPVLAEARIVTASPPAASASVTKAAD
jgi:lysylphosphatidylglycerol synthase-like protein